MFKSFRHNLLRLDSALAEEYIDYYSKTFKKIYDEEYLGDLFFSRCKKKELLTLINTPEKYYKKYKTKLIFEKIKRIRKQIISVNLTKNKHSVVVMGKELLGLK